MLRKQLFLMIAAAGLSTIGCVSSDYQFGVSRIAGIPVSDPQVPIVPAEECHPRLDRLEKMVHAPRRKLGHWFGKPFDPAREGDQQEQALAASLQYLADHGLDDVHVEHRRYAPSEQWQRLQSNQRIHPIFKYTDGAARVVSATLFPGRVFHTDSYNPYTNTLSVNSASIANAVLESAASRYDRNARYPGLRAASQRLPFVSAGHNSMIASDALSYSRAKRNWPLEKDLYPVAFGNIGSSLLGDVYRLNPVTGSGAIVARPVVSMVGGAVGAGAASVAIQLQEQQREPSHDSPGDTK